jgi:hypothetical protein
MELFRQDHSQYTVILCAYYGSTSRVRQKYASMWVNRGCSVVTTSNGVPELNSRAIHSESETTLKARCKTVLDTLIANGLDQNQIIFHLMSEGGMRNWLHIMQLLQTSQVRT